MCIMFMTIGEYAMGKITKRTYRVHHHDEVYIEDKFGDTREEQIENLRDNQIAKYRVKTIKSGSMLEVEAYPLFNAPVGKRVKRNNLSSAAQERLNNRNTIRHITRIMHANFTEKDMWSTWTYKNDRLPESPEEAKKDINNYIRRLKHWLKKNWPDKDFQLKYIYVTEFDDEVKGNVRIHHHMITNFPDRDIAEDLWNGGGRVQTRRLQPDDYGLEGLARYILKERKGKKTKRYSISRNMKKPTITVADSKMTRKRAERLVTEEINAQELFEKMYKGYKFNDMEAKFSQFVSGAYIYVRMKRIEPITKTKRRE